MNRAPHGAAPAPILPLKLLFLVSPFAAGLFYEPLSALASLVLLGYLGYLAHRDGHLTVHKSLLLLAAAVTVLFYAVSVLWATDRGAAMLGFIKFLPLPLFVIACGQLSAEQRRELPELLPWGGAAMTLLSGVLALVPAARDLVLVNGRLAGFFQYPNTFALYALLGVAVVSGREKWRAADVILLVVLMAGIALSGSRTVTALLAVFIVIRSAASRQWKRGGVLAGLAVVILAAAALVSGEADAVSSAGRALAGGAGASTFWGRLLYYRDALPVILRHPFGLGYMGYYYLQGSFQTGVYSVMHIHNDLLQLLLDVGWIPAGLLAAAVARRMLSRDCDLTRRLMIGLMAAHALFDFDLQFVAMDLILLVLLMPESDGAALRLPHSGAMAAGGVLAVLCLYFGLASALHYCGADTAAARVYPGYTAAWIDQMTATDDAAEMERAADRVLALNDAVSIAHSAKARCDYSRGDVASMIEHKRKAIALAKYDLSVYLDYFDMLAVCAQMYASAGDTASAAYCREHLLEIPQLLEQALDGTSALGRRIADQPELTLPEPYRQALEAMR